MPASGTGFSLLPDFGRLEYNGIRFSALYASEINGTVVADEANRTTKLMEWTLAVDGKVTLNPGDLSTDASWAAIRRTLSVHGAPLTYTGQGFGGLVVNVPGSPVRDVAFGPVPKVIYFQPLGQGRSANIRWQVTVRIPELNQITKGRLINNQIQTQTQAPGGKLINNQIEPPGPVLQYNYEASIGFDDDGYASLSIRGTLEIPMTRTGVNNRALPDIVDNYRPTWMNIQVDLTKFRVMRRTFNYSRDKRTCDFEFSAEELAPMGLPPGATNARGQMTVAPGRFAGTVGPAGILTGISWTVALRATYTIRKDWPARLAAEAFYALLWFRMRQSIKGELPNMNNANNGPQQPKAKNLADAIGKSPVAFAVNPPAFAAGFYYARLFGDQKPPQKVSAQQSAGVFLTHFGFTEGLYLDSKTITFEAAWWMLTTFSTLMRATGVWKWMPGSTGGNNWALSVQDIMGWRSWLSSRLDPTVDLIVDMGGGSPPLAPPVGD